MHALEQHRQAEELMGRADVAERSGDMAGAIRFRGQAAKIEDAVFVLVDPTKSVTRGAIAVSAAALYYKAGLYGEAIRSAHRSLGSGELLPSDQIELEELVQRSRQLHLADPTPNKPPLEIVTGRESLDTIIQTAFAVVSAVGQEDYGLLDRLVDSHNYRSAFVQHARQLAPDGALVGAVEVTRQGLGSIERARLTPASRLSISQYIAADSPPAADEERARTAVVSGTLRDLDLDKKTIRVETRGGQSQLCLIDRAIIRVCFTSVGTARLLR
jgi:hypothetical protein